MESFLFQNRRFIWFENANRFIDNGFVMLLHPISCNLRIVTLTGTDPKEILWIVFAWKHALVTDLHYNYTISFTKTVVYLFWLYNLCISNIKKNRTRTTTFCSIFVKCLLIEPIRSQTVGSAFTPNKQRFA